MLQYQCPPAVKYLPDNVHCNTLHSSCNNTVHLLWSIFQWTYLEPSPLSHASLNINTQYNKSHCCTQTYHRKTQQAVPNRTPKTSFHYYNMSVFNLLLVISCFINFKAPYSRSRRTCINIFATILHSSLQSIFGFSLCVGGNFMGVLRIRETMLHFLNLWFFADSCNNATSLALSQCRLKQLLAPSRMSVCPYWTTLISLE